MEVLIGLLGGYVVVTLLGVVAYFFTRKYLEHSMNYLGALLIISLLSDTFSLVNWYWLHLGTKLNIVVNSYFLLEGIIVILFYRLELFPSKKNLFYLLASLYAAAVLAEMFFFRGPMVYPGTTRSVIGIMVTVLGLLYFYQLIRDLPTTSIFSIPMFWINVGMLIYFTGNLFMFVMSDYLMYVLKDNMILYWSSHNILGIVSYSFFPIGLWQARKNALSATQNGIAQTMNSGQ